MVTVSFHQVCITTLSLGLACGVIASATKRWYGGGLFDLGDDTPQTAIKAMTIGGVGFTGFGLLLEILMLVSYTFKLSRAINVLCLLSCIISVIGLVAALSVYGANYSTGGFSVWLLTASSVFALEALLFYVVQWRFT